MSEILQGRGCGGGIVEAEAIVCPDSIAGNTGGLGDTDGIIHEACSSARGLCIKDKILVLPGAKGSNGFSAHFKAAALAGYAPAGWVVNRIDSRVGGAIASIGSPAVCDFEAVNPLEKIRTGDLLRLDGDAGTVEILKSHEV